MFQLWLSEEVQLNCSLLHASWYYTHSSTGRQYLVSKEWKIAMPFFFITFLPLKNKYRIKRMLRGHTNLISFYQQSSSCSHVTIFFFSESYRSCITYLGVDYHVVSCVGPAQDWSSHSVRAGGELAGLALPPPVWVCVGVGGGEGTAGGEGGEVQSEVTHLTAALTHLGLAGGRVAVCKLSCSVCDWVTLWLTWAREVGVVDVDGAPAALGEPAAHSEAAGTAPWGGAA